MLKLTDLKNALRLRGKKTTGVKDVLQQRLLEAMVSYQPPLTANEVCMLKLPDLKNALRLRGKKTTGVKDVLQQRLLEAMAPPPPPPPTVLMQIDDFEDGSNAAPIVGKNPNVSLKRPKKKIKMAESTAVKPPLVWAPPDQDAPILKVSHGMLQTGFYSKAKVVVDPHDGVTVSSSSSKASE